jgi:hypothetical protein
MQEINSTLLFRLFQIMTAEICRKYGMGQAYYQDQLEEARHQIKLQRKNC